jgi:hypothetical protein
VLVPLLKDARKVTVKDHRRAGHGDGVAGLIVSDIKTGRFTHAGQKPACRRRCRSARKKPYGDAGAFVWDFTSR